jgi:hypothetical protein
MSPWILAGAAGFQLQFGRTRFQIGCPRRGNCIGMPRMIKGPLNFRAVSCFSPVL